MWHLPPSLPIGPAALPTLPLAILAALLIWPPVAAVFARRLNLDHEGISQWATGLTVSVLLGSRLALLAAYPRDFLATPRALLTVGGPIARWGVMAGAVFACGWLLLKRRAEAWAWMEAVLAGLPLTLAVIAAGWSDPGSVPAVLGLTVASLVLMSAARNGPRPGQTALATVLLLAIVGFALPWFRLAAPDVTAVWPGWTWTQWALLVCALAAGAGLWLLEKRSQPDEPVGGDPAAES